MVSVVLLLFAIAWTISCLIERETYVATMGLFLFGGSALIFFVISKRLMGLKNP